MRRHRPLGRAAASSWRHGSERLGQEHAADHRRRPRGRRPAARSTSMADDLAAMSPQRAGSPAAAVDRLRVPGLQPARRADGGRERVAPVGARRRRGQAPPATSPSRRSRRFGLSTAADTSPTTCPAASASGWRSPAPSSATAGCCSPTSRPAPSTRSTVRGSCASSGRPATRGVAGVVVTHDAQLASWADRVVFLRDGHVVDQTMPPPGPESLLVTP